MILNSRLIAVVLAIVPTVTLSRPQLAEAGAAAPAARFTSLRIAAAPAAAATATAAQTSAELAAGVVPTAPQYAELDVRRYGAACDYDSKSETDGAAPRHATDNLPALKAALAVIKARGGGTMLIQGGGDCYLSNGFDGRGVSDLYIFVAPDTTVRTTRYTRLGGMLTLGSASADKPVRNVGIFGGGTLRNFRPDHAKLPRWQPKTPYKVGDYVLSTDSIGQPRAYYARTEGVSGAVPPAIVNSNASDGGVSWQDADNDNLVGISGTNVFLIGMNMPAASGKFATAQGLGGWKNVWFINNHGGLTNDKGFEVKGQMGGAGQEKWFGDGALIQGNVVDSAGQAGIEAEQSSQGVNRNRNIRIIDNVVKDAGVVGSSAGIRVNRADGVELRGNKVLRSRGNCYHLRQSSNVVGDLNGAQCGHFGAHLQELEGFSFDTVSIKGAEEAAVREAGGSGGGSVRTLEIGGNRAAGWQTINRKGEAPVVERYSIAGTGPQFIGRRPQFKAKAGAARALAAPGASAAGKSPALHAFTLTVANTAATLRPTIVDNGSSEGTDPKTNAGTINPASRNEFILDAANRAGDAQSAGTVVVSGNDTATAVVASLVRRSVEVNGRSAQRWLVQFLRQSDGSKFELDPANIPAGRKISVQGVIILP